MAEGVLHYEFGAAPCSVEPGVYIAAVWINDELCHQRWYGNSATEREVTARAAEWAAADIAHHIGDWEITLQLRKGCAKVVA